MFSMRAVVAIGETNDGREMQGILILSREESGQHEKVVAFISRSGEIFRRDAMHRIENVPEEGCFDCRF
jgi:hypothetical protein